MIKYHRFIIKEEPIEEFLDKLGDDNWDVFKISEKSINSYYITEIWAKKCISQKEKTTLLSPTNPVFY